MRWDKRRCASCGLHVRKQGDTNRPEAEEWMILKRNSTPANPSGWKHMTSFGERMQFHEASTSSKPEEVRIAEESDAREEWEKSRKAVIAT